jgi:hypothetical protein
MEDWQQRVFEEREELRRKISKLRGMLSSPSYEKLEDLDQLLLCRQERSMNAYQDILSERISRFKEPQE